MVTDKIERLERRQKREQEQERLRQKREQEQERLRQKREQEQEQLRQQWEHEEKLLASRIEAIAPLQAEAREAWKNDRKLIAGAYYKSKRSTPPRRIIELRGDDVHWSDECVFGWNGVCLRQTFLNKVEGPL
jgi:hypothetical protein